MPQFPHQIVLPATFESLWKMYNATLMWGFRNICPRSEISEIEIQRFSCLLLNRLLVRAHLGELDEDIEIATCGKGIAEPIKLIEISKMFQFCGRREPRALEAFHRGQRKDELCLSPSKQGLELVGDPDIGARTLTTAYSGRQTCYV